MLTNAVAGASWTEILVQSHLSIRDSYQICMLIARLRDAYHLHGNHAKIFADLPKSSRILKNLEDCSRPVNHSLCDILVNVLAYIPLNIPVNIARIIQSGF